MNASNLIWRERVQHTIAAQWNVLKKITDVRMFEESIKISTEVQTTNHEAITKQLQLSISLMTIRSTGYSI